MADAKVQYHHDSIAEDYYGHCHITGCNVLVVKDENKKYHAFFPKGDVYNFSVRMFTARYDDKHVQCRTHNLPLSMIQHSSPDSLAQYLEMYYGVKTNPQDKRAYGRFITSYSEEKIQKEKQTIKDYESKRKSVYDRYARKRVGHPSSDEYNNGYHFERQYRSNDYYEQRYSY